MYIKITENSETAISLFELKKKIDTCNNEADRVCKELGGESFATSSWSNYIAGDIDGIHFPNGNPNKEQWKAVGDSWQRLFYPKAKNKSDQQKISAVPRIKRDELNKIVGWPDGLQMVGLSVYHGPGVDFEHLLLEIPAGLKTFSLNADMTEIKESEYEVIKAGELLIK